MRSFTSQVETREIADEDLDMVSGGVSVSAGVTSLVGVSGGVSVDGLGEVLGAVAPALPLPQITGGAVL